jgi:hypothetical protein
MGPLRHFALQKISEPFRSQTTVKSGTDHQYWRWYCPLHCALDEKSCALAETANACPTERRGHPADHSRGAPQTTLTLHQGDSPLRPALWKVEIIRPRGCLSSALVRAHWQSASEF